MDLEVSTFVSCILSISRARLKSIWQKVNSSLIKFHYGILREKQVALQGLGRIL